MKVARRGLTALENRIRPLVYAGLSILTLSSFQPKVPMCSTVYEEILNEHSKAGTKAVQKMHETLLEKKPEYTQPKSTTSSATAIVIEKSPTEILDSLLLEIQKRIPSQEVSDSLIAIAKQVGEVELQLVAQQFGNGRPEIIYDVNPMHFYEHMENSANYKNSLEGKISRARSTINGMPLAYIRYSSQWQAINNFTYLFSKPKVIIHFNVFSPYAFTKKIILHEKIHSLQLEKMNASIAGICQGTDNNCHDAMEGVAQYLSEWQLHHQKNPNSSNEEFNDILIKRWSSIIQSRTNSSETLRDFEIQRKYELGPMMIAATAKEYGMDAAVRAFSQIPACPIIPKSTPINRTIIP